MGSIRIEGSSAVVTGGASGLGRVTAARLVELGAKVVLLDLPTSPGAQTAKELGERAVFVAGDVRTEQDAERAVAAAVELGPLRVTVNCAGIGRAGRTVAKDGTPYSLDAFRQVVEINLIGTFNVLSRAAAAMAATEAVDGQRGVIVNTASVAAFDGQIGQCAYSASKGGIVGMTLPIARDLAASGIRVLTIAPGLFETPLLGTLPQPALDSLGAQVPFPARLGRPSAYAELVAAIVANDYLNGEVTASMAQSAWRLAEAEAERPAREELASDSVRPRAKRCGSGRLKPLHDGFQRNRAPRRPCPGRKPGHWV
ncbi:SDR family NAD(P)-dependent oxidoreductase [Streptomyces sp. NPDC059743]|uniref:SDR family NAD(P)-dependent oxidoreductase n=1 Tax=Streptomyces sp. NPDC059743 TaxID=3346928 RepID=UPI0036501E01